MTKAYKIYDIDWDAEDGDFSADEANLPSIVHAEIELPDDIDDMDETDRDEFVGERLGDYLSDTYDFCVNGFRYEEREDDDDDDDSPSEDEILERIGVACEGRFGSVENVPGTVYIDEGGATYAVSVTKCDDCEG